MQHAHAYAEPEETQRPEHFKPGFVADSHSLRKILRSSATPPAAGRLLVTISDRTTGFQVEWAPLRRRKLMELADIKCEATLQNAKRWLLQHEHIQTRWNRSECCTEYALAEPLRVLLRPEERAARAKPTPSRKPCLQAVPDPHPLQPITPTPCNELQPYRKKNRKPHDHHQQDPPEIIPNPVSGDDVIITSGEVTVEVVSDTTDTVATEKNSLVSQLLAQLLAQGVNGRMAARLVTSQPADIIQRALERLPRVATKNPAGYVVAEIQAGGYKDPDPTKPLRIIRDEVANLRQAERERDREAKELSSARVATALEQFEQLPQEQQAGIIARLEHQAQAEGFNRLPGWSENHPAYSGLLAEILANRHATADD